MERLDFTHFWVWILHFYDQNSMLVPDFKPFFFFPKLNSWWKSWIYFPEALRTRRRCWSWAEIFLRQSLWEVTLQESDQCHLNSNSSAKESNFIRISLQSKERDADLWINQDRYPSTHLWKSHQIPNLGKITQARLIQVMELQSNLQTPWKLECPVSFCLCCPWCNSVSSFATGTIKNIVLKCCDKCDKYHLFMW